MTNKLNYNRSVSPNTLLTDEEIINDITYKPLLSNKYKSMNDLNLNIQDGRPISIFDNHNMGIVNNQYINLNDIGNI